MSTFDFRAKTHRLLPRWQFEGRFQQSDYTAYASAAPLVVPKNSAQGPRFASGSFVQWQSKVPAKTRSRAALPNKGSLPASQCTYREHDLPAILHRRPSSSTPRTPPRSNLGCLRALQACLRPGACKLTSSELSILSRCCIQHTACCASEIYCGALHPR